MGAALSSGHKSGETVLVLKGPSNARRLPEHPDKTAEYVA